MDFDNLNWSGTVDYRASELAEPRSVEELSEIIARADRVHGLGTRHSFSRVADTTGVLVSLARMTEPPAVDTAAGTVRVMSRTTYAELAPVLQAAGLALHNLGSLPHISVGGACSAATHGSGRRNGSVATAVRAVELVDAGGTLRRYDTTSDGFAGTVVGLGLLGVVTHLELAVQPSFTVRQDVYLDIPLDAALDHLDEILDAGYSVSLFTRWGRDVMDQAWIKSRVEPGTVFTAPEQWFGGRRATADVHPAPGGDASAATAQRGDEGPWFERLPHFRPEFRPSSGAETQSEYFVRPEHAADAYRALTEVGDRLAAALIVGEIRTVAGDDLWLSPMYGTDVVAFHFTWTDDRETVTPAVRIVEAALEPFQPRVHWGKVFTLDAATVRSRCPRRADFAALAAELDPDGTFANEFGTTYVL